MRWRGLLAGFGVVLVAATACNSQGAGGSGGVTTGTPAPGSNPPASIPAGPPSSPPAGPPVGPTPPPQSEPSAPPPADRTAVPASQVDFSALPAGFPHEVWVSADGKTLYIRAEEGGCGRASADVREQTAQRVVVDLVETQSTPKGQMCPMIIRYPVVSVPLAEPLGGRQVVLSVQKQPN